MSPRQLSGVGKPGGQVESLPQLKEQQKYLIAESQIEGFESFWLNPKETTYLPYKVIKGLTSPQREANVSVRTINAIIEIEMNRKIKKFTRSQRVILWLLETKPGLNIDDRNYKHLWALKIVGIVSTQQIPTVASIVLLAIILVLGRIIPAQPILTSTETISMRPPIKANITTNKALIDEALARQSKIQL